jgi:hypothetical protein
LASDPVGAVAGILASIAVERPSLRAGLDDDSTDDIAIRCGPTGISTTFIFVGGFTRSNGGAKDGGTQLRNGNYSDYGDD